MGAFMRVARSAHQSQLPRPCTRGKMSSELAGPPVQQLHKACSSMRDDTMAQQQRGPQQPVDVQCVRQRMGSADPMQPFSV